MLNGVVIESSRLIFDDTADYNFHCNFIMVNKGELVIGTTAAPH